MRIVQTFAMSSTYVWFHMTVTSVLMITGTLMADLSPSLPLLPFDILRPPRPSNSDQLFSADDNHRFCPPDPDACRTVTELIASKGYRVEEHSVTTADGFILSLQRILSTRSRRRGRARTGHLPVAFLQHGFADSAATWVMNGVNQSLGFILVDAGYDVWLGNVRGNTYSSKHASLNASDEEFWQWSWDEIQKFDLPAMINFVLNTTAQDRLSYIGHSQGTLIGFTGFTTDKLLAKKIKMFIALAPVATLSHIRGSAKLFSRAFVDCKMVKETFGSKKFIGNSDASRFIASTVCSVYPLGAYICQETAFQLAGRHFNECNLTRYQVIFSQFPAGTSVQNAQHFCQMSRSKKMAIEFFDYGSAELNHQHYNQTTPPEYDLSTMTVPTYLFSGSNDFLASPQDVRWIASRLPNVIRHEVMRGWNHMDFVWGVRAAPRLFRRIAKLLREN